ncbi:hypothetical protein T11_5823 [Trichinella zimbabwensis]|uniref:Uncharacterized protein n=1 Tax=Trichinella zimbabwensis TaxID=268475 RepID=A0A0V1H1Z4_9BILA|nr:hypothetical protein T11_5823 [Trichinella zimbabwensis]
MSSLLSHTIPSAIIALHSDATSFSRRDRNTIASLLDHFVKQNPAVSVNCFNSFTHSIVSVLSSSENNRICRMMRRWSNCIQVDITKACKNEEQLKIDLEFYYCRIWKMFACSLD